ncbi:MAG TPA: PEGA domain-containing protein, partial [Kofleriaceae bacterium]|nr:PEGA domain-containing protein [Kofleriaceae bacterium]
LSGMVALNLHGAQLAEHDVSTQPYLRPEAKTEPSTVVPSPGATIPEIPKPFSTVAGVAPPPIPVPPGVTSPPGPPPPPAGAPAKTILGLSAAKKPQIPSIIPPITRPNGPPPTPPRPPTLPARSATTPARPAPPSRNEPSGLLDVDMTPLPPAMPPEPDDIATMPARDPATLQGLGGSGAVPAARPAKPTPSQSFETRTGEMSSMMLDELNKRSVKNTGEILSLDKALEQLPDVDARSPEAQAEPPAPPPPNPKATMVGVGTPASTPPPATESSSGSGLALPLQPRPVTELTPVVPATPPAPKPADKEAQTEKVAKPSAQPAPITHPAAPAKRSRAPLVLLVLLLLGGLGAGGWYAYTTMYKQQPETVAGTTPHDAAAATRSVDASAVAVATSTDAGAATPVTRDAAALAVATPDAAVAKATPDAALVAEAADAGVEVTEATPTAPSDKLKITSKPKGARVFIDGADQGTTPVELDGSADRHTMVLLLPGHDLYVAEVDGHGQFDIALKPITPGGGYAGIKVIKCKDKERYYVYVDGKPTGMTCPTERIDTVIGDHTVEVYDIVTDSRRSWDIHIKDDRLSFRIRIDK